MIPVLPTHVVGRIVGHHACFDAGRGCPFQCSFCTIINVQGRKSRYRTADDVEAIVRAKLRPGHQPLFRHRRQFRPQPQLGGDPRPADRAPGDQGIPIKLILQVDTLCHRIPEFHREGGAGRAATRCSSDSRASIRNCCRARRSGRIRSGNTGSCCRPGAKQKVMTWAGLITGFSDRHARIDRPRHRDHQEGAAARHPRILLPDAAARLRGPPSPSQERGPDGPRHEQIRS